MSGYLDLTLRCPTCGLRADQCFRHGDAWKKRTPAQHLRTEAQLRAVVHDFTEDDPPPYPSRGGASALDALERARRAQEEHDRRVDVQLRLPPDTCPTCRGTGGRVYNDYPTCDGNGVVA